MASRKSGTKSTNSKNKTNNRRSNNKKVDKKASPVRIDIVILSVICLSVILVLANAGIAGQIGSLLSDFLFGLFGVMNYIFPFLLAAGTVYFAIERKSHEALRKIIYGALLFVFICMLMELLRDGGNPGNGYSNCFIEGYRDHAGGGFFGGSLLASIFVRAFGLAGAYVINILALLILIVLMTEKSLFNAFSGYFRAVSERESDLDCDEDVADDEELNGNDHDKRNSNIRRRESHSSRSDKEERNNLRPGHKKIPDKKVMNTNIHPGRKHRDVKNPSLRKELRDGSVTGVMTGVNFNTDINPDIRSGFDPGDEVSEITGNHSSLYPVTSEVNEEVSPVSEEVSNANEVNAPSDIQIHGMVETNRTGNTREMTGSSSANINDTAYGNISDSGSKKISGNNTGDNTKTIKREQMAGGIEDIHDSKNVKPYVFPPVKLLSSAGNVSKESGATLKRTAEKLEVTLRNFGINVKITDISCGPTVTRYELQPEMGVKVSKIVNLQDDIKMNLAATDIRIEAPIPGKAAVGIEVPNKKPSIVSFRELVESDEFKNNKSRIAFAAGKDIAGKPVISDIAKMPHLLIAGATGSGKSVCINTIIMSILYRADPSEVKFIMIDPKVVELSVYNGIPHLLMPVVTDPKKASGALKWAVKEMTDRYKTFSDANVRDIKGYNAKIKNGRVRIRNGSEEMEIAAEKMPQIVVIVDELADLMMVSSSEVEESICRLAQLARAAGIHLIIATQRPSVNVITGLIKANMPSRIAFSVTSGVDSRTILDMNGAEKLLGKGDMLYYPQGLTKPLRVQGAFVSDDDVQNVVTFIKQHNTAEYDNSIREAIDNADDGYTKIDGNGSGLSDERDTYFNDAALLIVEKEKASIGMLQRNFKIGFNRAARIMDQLEEAGVVGPEEGTKPRIVMVKNKDELNLLLEKERK